MMLRVKIFAGLAALLAALAGLSPGARAGSLTFQTLDNNADPTFNQLLGINNTGTIAGYFGIGSTAHPNKGYTLAPPYGQGNYTNENFPGSFQTQVTGLNNSGQTVGFWADTAGDNFGWVKTGPSFVQVVNPLTPPGAPGTTTMNQLLGINDNNQAAGFYLGADGNSHGYVYNVLNGTFTAINVTGATSVTATGINNNGLVSGFFTATISGNTLGFLENVNGTGLQTFEVPGSTNTMFLGLNNKGQEVGTYIDSGMTMHGLLFTTATQTVTNVDDPNGVGTTTINGLNDQGQLVGFYVGGDDFTHGVLVNTVPEPSSMALLGVGLTAVLGYFHRRRTKRAAAQCND
jgi:PEP-CTERM motif